MKWNRYISRNPKTYVYAGAQLSIAALVVWLASSAAAPLGTLAQALIGVALAAGYALISAAVALALREARDRVAEMVAHELARKDTTEDVEALADSVFDMDRNKVATHITDPKIQWSALHAEPGRHRAVEDPERTEPEDPALFTHDQLFGSVTRDL